MTTYTKHFSTKKTSQNSPIPGKDQKKNRAGGYTYTLDMWAQLDRFLILGTEGGTYYASEKEMSIENSNNLLTCIKANGVRVVNRIVEFSVENRAPKQAPLLFSLAVCAKMGDENTKRAAYQAVTKVCRIGTHLFELAQNIKHFGGFAQGTKRAFSRWYNEMAPGKLGYQLIKYAQRGGMSHRDILRMAHATPVDEGHNTLFQYAVRKLDSVPKQDPFMQVWAAEEAKTADAKTVIGLIEEYNLPQEAIPSELKGDKKVMDALLQRMPMTATIRGLGKMSAKGLLDPLSDNQKMVVKRITDAEALVNARVHPVTILNALFTYKSGGGHLSNLTWEVNQKIVDALDKAFYLSFKSIKPTGKNFYLAIDVSGSMGFTTKVCGLKGLTARDVSAAMAMVTARTEKNYYCAGFSAGGRHNRYLQFGADMVEIGISSEQRLDDVIAKISNLPFGGTDCALPMIDAEKRKIEVDTFVVYTDNETWAGDIHPSQALESYRQKMGRDAKLIVVGMTATEFTIANPNDAGMLDIAGFDGSAPRIMSEFTLGNI